MSTDTLQNKAHELIGQLDPDKLAAVVHLLEVMVEDNDEDEVISAEEEAAVARSKEWFQHNEGIPFEQFVADLGFTMDQVRTNTRENPAA
ncbi:MAG: hypothetical protein J0L64_03970 [Acidobacteria bacterium]|nr:hypothetical protein [Acidobacteriota bacterium]